MPNKATGIIECLDVDECQLEQDVCPGPFDFCENRVGGFDCPCESQGFDRSAENEECSDINECEGIDGCEKHVFTGTLH